MDINSYKPERQERLDYLGEDQPPNSVPVAKYYNHHTYFKFGSSHM